MNSWRLVLVFLAVAMAGVDSQKFFFGSCPSQTVVTTFDAILYLNRWYEQQKYFTIFQAGGSCVTADYSLVADDVIGVLNTQKTLIGTTTTIQGTARFKGPQNEAKLLVTFPSVGSTPANYWVLDTDYTGYAVVWSCTNYIIFNTQYMWILTRAKNPSDTYLSNIRQGIYSRGLAVWPLKRTRQTCDN